jgi:hypothetical protein
MRLYDGRTHSCLGLVDATRTWSPSDVTIESLLNAEKSREFKADRLRLLWMLQVRTDFHSSNLSISDSIRLSDYENMYDPSVRDEI